MASEADPLPSYLTSTLACGLDLSSILLVGPERYRSPPGGAFEDTAAATLKTDRVLAGFVALASTLKR
jgi:hypothetical protein